MELNWNPEKRSIRQLKDGQLEGLRWIYERFADKLLNQSYRILLSREQAEDVVQDLFIRLPRIIQEFKEESALGTWLFRVTHNMCLSRLAQGRNRSKLEWENAEDLSPRGAGKSYELSDLLAKAMAELDPETRSILWLKEGEGASLKELGAIFKLPEGTLKSRLSRAKEKLRAYLDKELKVENA